MRLTAAAIENINVVANCSLGTASHFYLHALSLHRSSHVVTCASFSSAKSKDEVTFTAQRVVMRFIALIEYNCLTMCHLNS